MFSFLAVQVIGSGMYSPTRDWNFKLLQDSQTVLKAALSTLPILLGDAYPHVQVAREHLKIGIGGGQYRFQEAVRLETSLREVSRSQPCISHSKLRLQAPIPVQEKSRSEVRVEYLLKAQHSSFIISAINLEVSLGNSSDYSGLPPEVRSLIIRDSIAQLPGSFIVENECTQPCFSENKKPGRVAVFLGGRFSVANNSQQLTELTIM